MIELAERLSTIGLKLSPDTLTSLLKHASDTKLSHVQLLEKLVTAESAERDARNLARRSRSATLGVVEPLDGFDWNHPRSIDRTLYEQLHASLDFVERGENILFRGQAGVGKSTLAKNLGLRALQHGHSVRFASLQGALADLLQQESLPATERRLKKYTLPDLLILDELGYVPCDARAADLLFHIISRRHEKRSVIITTNLAFKQWGATFHDAPCLSALIDRFAQNCHTLDIDADSWRKKLQQLRKKKRTSEKIKTK